MSKVAALALITLAAASPLPASAGHLPLGGSSELRCTQKGDFGLFVTSDRPVTCVFYRPDGAVEFYTGSFHRIGLDVGPTNALRLAFSVSTGRPVTAGALDGNFVGAGTQVAAGEGLGTDALIGGATGAATLTPVANEYLTGLNLNAGIGALELHYRGMERSRYR